jgi:hypothetical protein
MKINSSPERFQCFSFWEGDGKSNSRGLEPMHVIENNDFPSVASQRRTLLFIHDLFSMTRGIGETAQNGQADRRTDVCVLYRDDDAIKYRK